MIFPIQNLGIPPFARETAKGWGTEHFWRCARGHFRPGLKPSFVMLALYGG